MAGVDLPAGGYPDFEARLRDYNRKVDRCSRCLFDMNTPHITFDANGVCNYCRVIDQMDREHPTGKAGALILEQTVEEIRREGRGKPFDVVVGVSGGCDSSYMLAKAVEWGLRPIAAHFDNTWNTTTATRNIHGMLEQLGVELYTHVVDNEVFNDMTRAFMDAGLIDIDATTDIGLATTLYQAAEKYGIRYQLEGHSFRTEGTAPLGWIYMDGQYIRSVVEEFGNYRRHKMRSFPNLTFARFMKYTIWQRTKKIRPLYWIDYDKEATKKWLSSEFGWEWYGGHHLENRFTSFFHCYYAPRRYGLDTRVIGYSGLIRSKQMPRAEGLELLQEPFHFDPGIVDMVKKRLGFSDAEFEAMLRAPRTTYRDFKTYKKRFERMRPLFKLLAAANLVPKTFYIKYTSKDEI